MLWNIVLGCVLFAGIVWFIRQAMDSDIESLKAEGLELASGPKTLMHYSVTEDLNWEGDIIKWRKIELSPEQKQRLSIGKDALSKLDVKEEPDLIDYGIAKILDNRWPDGIVSTACIKTATCIKKEFALVPRCRILRWEEKPEDELLQLQIAAFIGALPADHHWPLNRYNTISEAILKEYKPSGFHEPAIERRPISDEMLAMAPHYRQDCPECNYVVPDDIQVNELDCPCGFTTWVYRYGRFENKRLHEARLHKLRGGIL